MDNLRRLGGGAGVLSGLATVWLTIGLTVVFPAAGLSLKAQEEPNKYLAFIAKHQILFWTTDVLGGVVAALAVAILMVALADRFHEESRDQSRLGLALGGLGALGLVIGAFVKFTALGYLSVLYASAKQPAAIAFYAVNGTAHSFLALGAAALGISALVFGSLMLRTPGYSRAGYVSVVAGAPSIISAFVASDVLFVIASGLMSLWFAWAGILLWVEAMSSAHVRSARNGRVRQFKVVGRRREGHAI